MCGGDAASCQITVTTCFFGVARDLGVGGPGLANRRTPARDFATVLGLGGVTYGWSETRSTRRRTRPGQLARHHPSPSRAAAFP